MVRLTQEHILLINDARREVHDALLQAAPGAQVETAPTVFDGIAKLSANRYTTVMAAVEPIERRPEAAVKTLRELSGGARLLLFGQPAMEGLSRKMLNFGCDDYIVTPANPAELSQIFGAPPLRLSPPAPPPKETPVASARQPSPQSAPVTSAALSVVSALELSEILLESLLSHPNEALQTALEKLNAQLAPSMQLIHTAKDAPAPPAPAGMVTLSLPVNAGSPDSSHLHLILPRTEDESAARHFLAQFAHLIGKLVSLQERHDRLQRLAITDDLTGVYNGRYFRHFVTKIVERASELRFPVTLLLFDIDNFKKYNDQFGHGVGDEILKQTAVLMKRCVRDHDLVARISGDEFAVVFWEKDSHRQPRDPANAGTPGRPPQTPIEICERFRRLLATPDFTAIGPMGQGTLTISGGLAVFPYDAQSATDLITAADHALMFGAKTSGKNSIYLIGDTNPPRASSAPSFKIVNGAHAASCRGDTCVALFV